MFSEYKMENEISAQEERLENSEPRGIVMIGLKDNFCQLQVVLSLQHCDLTTRVATSLAGGGGLLLLISWLGGGLSRGERKDQDISLVMW